MILEGIVTSLDAEGRINVAPMGPLVTPLLDVLVLRPFQSSQTYRNLKARPSGVFHVVDDVLLLARAALNRFDAEPATFPAERVSGRVLENCCRWYEFEVAACDDSQERTRMEARVVHAGRRHDFFGFNRAKHAALEATILATRLHLLSPEEVRRDIARLEPLVDKTAGDQERAAWELVVNYITAWYASPAADKI
jgi:hypothetical protein